MCTLPYNYKQHVNYITWNESKEKQSVIYMFFNRKIDVFKIGLVGRNGSSNTLVSRFSDEARSVWSMKEDCRCLSYLTSNDVDHLEPIIIEHFERQGFEHAGKESFLLGDATVEDIINQFIWISNAVIFGDNDMVSRIFVINDDTLDETDGVKVQPMVQDIFPAPGTWMYNGRTPFTVVVTESGEFEYEGRTYKTKTKLWGAIRNSGKSVTATSYTKYFSRIK